MDLGRVSAITLFVSDLAKTKAFYGGTLGRPVVVEDSEAVAFSFGNLIVNCLQSDFAPDLIAPAPVADAGAGSRYQLTIDVTDVDAVVAELAAAGVALINGPVDRPWGVRTALFADPDGHLWELAAPVA